MLCYPDASNDVTGNEVTISDWSIHIHHQSIKCKITFSNSRLQVPQNTGKRVFKNCLVELAPGHSHASYLESSNPSKKKSIPRGLNVQDVHFWGYVWLSRYIGTLFLLYNDYYMRLFKLFVSDAAELSLIHKRGL